MPKLNWQIVDRYFAGEASDAERTLVERWLAASPAFRELVKELYRSGLDDSIVRSDQEEVRARIERDIAAARRHSFRRRISHEVVTAIRQRGVLVLRAAAIATLLLGGSLLILQVARTADPQQINLPHTLTAPSGRRTALTLPDGSKVILSPGSTLEYASLFTASESRQVSLEGEAYFDVRHDTHRPFVVRAGNLVAEDLGTQFVVRAYPEDAYGRVIVREGLVGIGGVVVSPGEIGWISASGTPVVEPIEASGWFAWTEGRLVFDGMTFRDALPKLSRWYGRELRLADPALGDIVLVATLPEKPTDDAFNAIALALGLHVEHDGNAVTFSAAPSATPPAGPSLR